MPTFDTPRPIVLDVDLAWSDLRVVASERTDTVVTIVPLRPEKAGDVKAAAEAQIELVGDVLTVHTAKSWRMLAPFGNSGAVDVTIEVPEGSDLHGSSGSGRLLTEGVLGAVSYRTGSGDVRIDEAERVTVRTPAGGVTIGRASGTVEVNTPAGSIRIRELAGEAVIKNPNGTTNIGEVTGTLTVHGAHADIMIQNARGRVTAKSAYGAIVVERIDGGEAQLETGYGTIEVGIGEATAAWLDVSSEHGSVRNMLTPSDAPGADESTVELRARSNWGDILIRRPDRAPTR